MSSTMNAALVSLQALQWPPLGMELVIKGTLLLAGAYVVNSALSRTAAATRHFVWCLAFAFALVLPVLSIALPPLGLPVPSALASAAPETLPAPVAAGRGMTAPLPQAAPSRLGADPATTVAPAAPRSVLATMGWPAVRLAWAAGSLLLVARLLAGAFGISRLTRRTRPVVEPAWTAAAGELSELLGLRAPVRLLVSDRATVPVTWGYLRPSILLPADVDAWPAGQLRAVLLHELAHVKRRDCLIQVLVQLACALYWWNPLVWVAAHRLCIEREQACDDEVLGLGTRASDYAGYLLDIARSVRVSPVVALAMAHRSQLEGRLLAILDPRPRPRGMSRLIAVTCLAAGICLILPLAALEPAPDGAGAVAAETSRPGVVKTFAVRPGGLLRLSSDLPVRGRVAIVPWDQDEVQIAVRKELQGGGEARQVSIEARQQGTDVQIEARAEGRVPEGAYVGYEIHVPRRFDVRLQVSSGNVEVGDLRGDVEVATGGGAVTIGHIRDGSVRVEVAGGRISLAGVQNGDAELESAGGPISVGPVSGRLKAVTEGGDIRVAEIGGPAEVRSGGGSVEARLAPGVVADWSLETRSGDLVLQVPQSLAATIDTEIRVYQEKEGSLGDPARAGFQVHSDFPLSTSAPRVVEDDADKRVSLIASRGRAGGGAARLQLSTVNGDIHIRKYSR